MRTLILSSIGGEIPDAVRTSVTLCKALKLLRIGRLLRKVDALSGANFARVMQYIFGLLLVAHWLGIVWYAIAIQPLQRVYPGPSSLTTKNSTGQRAPPSISPTCLPTPTRRSPGIRPIAREARIVLGSRRRPRRSPSTRWRAQRSRR